MHPLFFVFEVDFLQYSSYISHTVNITLFRGYHTVVRRYEFYFQVAKQFLPLENKINIVKLPCNVLFII